MISFEDKNNNIHNFCPRCKGELRYYGAKKANYIICDSCKLEAYPHRAGEKKCFITVDLENYEIYWQKDECVVGDKEDDKFIHLPLLPFDITINKLKIYLVFS